MKNGIHPKYHDCTITCGCGAVFQTRSTKKEINIAICGCCHPFYTGKQKFVDTAGRIELFQRRYQIAEGESTEKALGRQPSKRKQAASAARTAATIGKAVMANIKPRISKPEAEKSRGGRSATRKPPAKKSKAKKAKAKKAETTKADS